MATVLGIVSPTSPFMHDNSASIVRDGKILASIQEERMSGVKHDTNTPINSIKECFRLAGLTGKDIDAIVCATEAFTQRRFTFEVNRFGKVVMSKATSPISFALKHFYMRKLKEWFGIRGKIMYMNHHLSHAATAFYTSGYKSAAVVTLDGLGDHESGSIYAASGMDMKRLWSQPEQKSLGLFYGMVSESLGFTQQDGEGKTMGFACYGKPHAAEHIAKFYDRNEMEPAVLRDINTTDGKLFAAYRYVRTKQSVEFKESFKHFKPEDIAASAQKVLEEKGLEIVKMAMEKTGETNIAVAGGVFLNCKLNQRIRELPGEESLFIHPAAGDNGVCTGAAIEACRILDPHNFRPEKMEHVYYGSGYTNEEIEKNIKDYNLSYERLKDPAGTAADLIKKGKVVGWFQGRMEYGPRALGNRSVLADPTDPKMRDRINQFLKKRDWFMPFCPSMLFEAKDEYLVNPTEAPFMITTFDVPKNKAKEIPAVVHVDNTARPQTVKKEVNPLYWRLIKQFEKYKVPMVLNTSFNKHGLPMIRTPQDALNHLVWKCVDVLIMDDFLIERKFV